MAPQLREQEGGSARAFGWAITRPALALKRRNTSGTWDQIKQEPAASRMIAANSACGATFSFAVQGREPARGEEYGAPISADGPATSDTNCPIPQRADLSPPQRLLGASHILENIRRRMQLVHVGLRIGNAVQPVSSSMAEGCLSKVSRQQEVCQ